MEKISEKQKVVDIKKKSSDVNTVETEDKTFTDSVVVDKSPPAPTLVENSDDDVPPIVKKSWGSKFGSALKWIFIIFSFLVISFEIYGTFYEYKWKTQFETVHVFFDITCVFICSLLYGLDTTGFLEKWFRIDSVRQVTLMTVAVPIISYIMQLYTAKEYIAFLTAAYILIILLVLFEIIGIAAWIRDRNK